MARAISALSAAVALSLAVVTGSTAAAAASSPSKSPPPAAGTRAPAIACTDLVGLSVPASAIGLQTTGGTVTSASPSASYRGAAYCDVKLAVHPVHVGTPDITVGIALPAGWTGTTMMFGGGGYDGSVPDIRNNAPFGDGVQPLDRGMVVYGSDSGHTNAATSLPTLDGSFGQDDEALRNFAGDALKKTHDATAFVVQRYYGGTQPAHSYFAGGSSGGREALAVVQRWPADFDGVIAAYPAYSAATLDLWFGMMARELAKPGAFPSPTQQKLLYQSVVAACDGQDGVVDGLVSNPAACHYDPSVLRCPVGVDPATPTCLSDAMITALKKLSSPWTLPQPTASGETGYPGFPLLSGADMTAALLGYGSQPPANPMPQTAAYGAQFWDQWVKYFVTRDAGYNSLSLDPANPGPLQTRIDELTKLQDVNQTDLGAFARRGGKLLMVHGTADELVSHRATVDYYQRVQATMGANRTRDFSRLYLVPGAAHANIGGAYYAAWDSVSALDTWVSNGTAPTNQIVADTTGARTRPLCEYTQYPKYIAGDVNAAASFSCVTS